MKDDTERQAILMERVKTGLSPVSAFDDELLSRYALKAQVEVSIKQRRSSPQNRLYWTTLNKVVEATGRWASSEHLHKCLKIELGYVEWIETLAGRGRYCIPDSTAFAKMDQAQFKTYFDEAMKLLTEMLGTDPLGWMTTSDLRLVLEASAEQAA